MKIAFVNGKGGVGKSTLCYMMGLCLKQAGKSVGIVDADDQGSLRDLTDPKMGKFTEDGEVILVDTKGSIKDDGVIQAVKEADRIVIPTIADPFALPIAFAAETFAAKLKKKKAKGLVVLNQVDQRKNLSKAAPGVLEEHLKHFPLAKTQIITNGTIPMVGQDGWSSLDIRVRSQITNLTLEVLS